MHYAGHAAEPHRHGRQAESDPHLAAGSPAPTSGYNVYYDQNGKYQYIASNAAGTTTYTNSGLSRATTYCYRVTAWNDCNGNGVFDLGIDTESSVSNIACATTN